MNRIKEYRKIKNISQNNISKMIGVRQSTFSQWENDEREPSVRNAIRLAELLETTVESLYK